MIYRVKQFIWASTSYFKKIDYPYIDKYLNNKEKQLFERLRKSDKQHCIRVSKDALKYIETAPNGFEIDEKSLGKLTLLHDIGKVERPLNSIEKSIVVLFHKITKGKIRKYTNVKIIDTYYNHPQKGAKILKKIGYDKCFLEAVENHHNKYIDINNGMLEILQICDDKN